MHLQLNLTAGVVVSDLRFAQNRLRLLRAPVGLTPIPDGPATRRAKNISGANVARVVTERGTACFRAAGQTDLRKITGTRDPNLLGIAQHVRFGLFQKWPPLFRQLDCFRQRHVPRLILQAADRFQGRAIAAVRIEIETQCFGELELRDAVIIFCGDQFRILIRKSDLRLEDVKTRHGSRLKTILLVLQLTLQQLHRFILHSDEREI